MTFARSRGCCTYVLFLISLSVPIDTQAAIKNWTGGSGDWSPGNWSPAGAPAANDPTRIVFTDGIARTVTLNADTPTLGLVAIDLTGAGTAANTLSIPNNNTITVGALAVGGHNGVTPTNGRGALTQLSGNLTSVAGTDIVVGWGAGSAGTYTLGGNGALTARQSLYVGSNGAGTFNHFAGTATVSFSTVGSFTVGVFAGSNGTYNLSGTGELVTQKSQYIGYQGVGTFTQTGGSNRLTNAFLDDLYIGDQPGSFGTYGISGGEFYTAGNVSVGAGGAGTLNISGTGDFSADSSAYSLSLGPGGTLNISGGKLRVANFNRAPSSTLSYTAGAIQMPGDRTLNSTNASDTLLNTFFPAGPSQRAITSGKELIVGGTTRINDATLVSVSGGRLTSQGPLEIGLSGSPLDYSSLFVVNGSTVQVAQSAIGTGGTTGELVLDGNSTFRATNGIQLGGAGGSGILQVFNSLVDAGSSLFINEDGFLHVHNSTLRFNTYARSSFSTLEFVSGEIQLIGHRTIGPDAAVKDFFGTLPTMSRGKSLVVEGIATLTTPLLIQRGSFKTNSLVIQSGGALEFDSGVLEINGGVIQGLAELVVPTNGEFRGRNLQEIKIVGAAGSKMTATGVWAIGDPSAPNGFYTNGALSTGFYTVTLHDANDAVLDSGALVTIGTGANAGGLNAPNGLTLDFGGNIQGFGSITTPNDPAKPFINNGHISGTGAGAQLNLTGYVKGVGTLDHVTVAGTLAPGLSPTSMQVGSLRLTPTSTLVMEIGGTSPGSGYDQLLSSGTLVLDGALHVQLWGGFNPSLGQSFNLFDWSSVSGAFTSIMLPSLAGLAWDTSNLYATGTISVVAATPTLPGDYNQDGSVDTADYVLWRKTDNSATGYNTWRTNFGRSLGGGSAHHAPVPEPASTALLLIATLAANIRRSRTRQR